MNNNNNMEDQIMFDTYRTERQIDNCDKQDQTYHEILLDVSEQEIRLH